MGKAATKEREPEVTGPKLTGFCEVGNHGKCRFAETCDCPCHIEISGGAPGQKAPTPPASETETGPAGEPVDAGGHFEWLPLRSIVPSPENVRHNLGDLSELSMSISSVGIVEPLIVERCIDDDPEHDYHLVAGERRWTAAGLAGIELVPAIVREAIVDGDERIELMLIENLQRKDLEPLEEAEGYRRLTEFGMTQRTIAERVGCSQAHVSKRLGLLLLPDKARAELDSGGITLEQATALARMHDEPDRIEKALKGKGENRHWAIEREVSEFEADRKIAKVRTELTDAGVTIVDEYDWKSVVGHNAVDVDKVKHQDEPCRAVHVSFRGELVELCTEPKRHRPRGESTLKVKPQPKASKVENDWEKRRAEEEAKREAKRQEIAELVAPRRAFVRTLVEKPDPEFVHRLLLSQWLGGELLGDDVGAAELLGLTVETGQQGDEAVREFAAKGARNALRALCALVIAEAERVVTPNGYRPEVIELEDYDLPFGERYFAELEKLGYELSDHDRAVLCRAEAGE